MEDPLGSVSEGEAAARDNPLAVQYSEPRLVVVAILNAFRICLQQAMSKLVQIQVNVEATRAELEAHVRSAEGNLAMVNI